MAASVECPIPIAAQLADIALLKDGWLDGEGTVYHAAIIDRARAVFTQLLEHGGVEMPYLYPSEDGDLRAEWNHPDRAIVVVLETAGQNLRLLAIDNAGDTMARRESFQATPLGIKALASRLEQLLKSELL